MDRSRLDTINNVDQVYPIGTYEFDKELWDEKCTYKNDGTNVGKCFAQVLEMQGMSAKRNPKRAKTARLIVTERRSDMQL